MFEKVQMMIQAELTLMRAEMEREMVKTKEAYKAQLNNELSTKLSNMMRTEVEVVRGLWEKELETTMTTFATWKSEMEKRLKDKDTLIDGLKREITEFRNRLEKAKED